MGRLEVIVVKHLQAVEERARELRARQARSQAATTSESSWRSCTMIELVAISTSTALSAEYDAPPSSAVTPPKFQKMFDVSSESAACAPAPCPTRPLRRPRSRPRSAVGALA